MAAPNSKNYSTSTDSKTKEYQQLASDAPVPGGVELSDSEMLVYGQLYRARSDDKWRECDLIILSKIAMFDIAIRDARTELYKTGLLVLSSRGDMVENPLCKIISKWESTQLSYIRCLSLGTHKGEDLNKTGVKIGTARGDKADDDLL